MRKGSSDAIYCLLSCAIPDSSRPCPIPTTKTRNVMSPRRLRGGFGHVAPYGHEPLELQGWPGVMFTLDMVGGVVGSLCAAYRSVTTFDRTGHHVNLLFDHETDRIRVESPYTHPHLKVTLKKPGLLWIRMPSWVEPQRVEVKGTTEAPRFTAGRLLVFRQPVGPACDRPIRAAGSNHRPATPHTQYPDPAQG